MVKELDMAIFRPSSITSLPMWHFSHITSNSHSFAIVVLFDAYLHKMLGVNLNITSYQKRNIASVVAWKYDNYLINSGL